MFGKKGETEKDYPTHYPHSILFSVSYRFPRPDTSSRTVARIGLGHRHGLRGGVRRGRRGGSAAHRGGGRVCAASGERWVCVASGECLGARPRASGGASQRRASGGASRRRASSWTRGLGQAPGRAAGGRRAELGRGGRWAAPGRRAPDGRSRGGVRPAGGAAASRGAGLRAAVGRGWGVVRLARCSGRPGRPARCGCAGGGAAVCLRACVVSRSGIKAGRRRQVSGWLDALGGSAVKSAQDE